ncbi:MAG TPA: helix-turn-helix domain-containing protein [Edaphobacter sp.]|nr:helix-turn-helix domain-containing protein [Edaphobacter sp.]
MIYLEHRAHPALAPFIKMLWYARDPDAAHRHERVLPTGNSQIVISLARDYLTDANNVADPLLHSPASILLGIYSRHQQIDAIDLAELIGIVFKPGGTLPFFRENARLFANCETALEDIWGNDAEFLRDQLRESATPKQKFALLEDELLRRLHRSQKPHLNPVAKFVLDQLCSNPCTTTITRVNHQTGFSSRHISQLFCQQIGVSPKLYCRILRFQQAVQQMHCGADIRWAELALACGYYDQSHFSNDFHAFSGLSPTAYIARPRRWSNHIPLD